MNLTRSDGKNEFVDCFCEYSEFLICCCINELLLTFDSSVTIEKIFDFIITVC